MKIAMVLQRPLDLLPSDSRVMREAQALAAAGHRVVIVVYWTGRGVRRESLAAGVEAVAVPMPDITGFEAMNIFRPGRPPVAGQWGRLKQLLAHRLYRRLYLRETVKVLVAEQADAYHCHDFHTLKAGALAAQARGSLLVYDSHEIFTETMAFEGLAGRLKKPLYRQMEKRLIRQAHRVITVGEGCARFLAARYGIPKPLVLENVADPLEEHGNSREAVRRALGVGPEQRLLMYQGLLAPGRGLETLLETMPRLPANILLALVGNGPSEVMLRARTGELGIRDRVRFIGMVPREQLLYWVRAADVGVIPLQKRCLNYYYALPNKVFECMAAGVPFAASDFPDLRRLAVEEDLGVVFDPKDPASISRAVLALLNERPMYERKRANIVRSVANRYNWSRVSVKLLGVYAEGR
jgi:glycosyltransferase involved in cell wall biosynthesis